MSCDHKFVDSKRCLRCGIGFAALKAESLRESLALQEPELCGECGVIHRPGENTLCPGWRPGPFVPAPADAELPEGWTFSPALGGAFVSKREDGGRYALTITLLRALLATQGLSIVTAAERRMLEACSKVITDMEGSILGDSERAIRMRERQGYRRIRALLRPGAEAELARRGQP